MELILKQDVDNVGFKDDIVTVKNGYGRNYLIPHGFAVLATSSAKKVLAEIMVIDAAQKQADGVKALEIKIASKVGSGDKLFGSVNNINLVEALDKAGFSIDRKFVTVTGGSVKRLGKYNATVRLHREVKVDLAFEVVAQK
jgi:large subunit ribosomal protein L9